MTARSLDEVKTRAREAAFARRKVAHGTGLDEAANEFLFAHITEVANISVVSAYMAIRTEIDPAPTMHRLVASGYRVCVPVIEGRGVPLVFREWTPNATLVPGPFGARVPDDGAVLEPDLLITPLLAFDAAGYRLGYGGGYYDRTFDRLRAMGKGVGVGFAYSAQQVDAVPIETTDARLDAMVTELGVTSFA